MTQKTQNTLFPIFLKLENLPLLIVGGGKVGLEKLEAVLQNSPATDVRMVSYTFLPEIVELVRDFPNVVLIEKGFEEKDLADRTIVILALNDLVASQEIQHICKRNGKLVNVADKPELCDFYLGSVVRKGNLKIAISTNGKSPTVAKRIKETLNEVFPDEIDELLDKMQAIRNSLSGDFAYKVQRLNEITETLAPNL